jgi:uncharacterized membrane protein
MGAGTFTIIVLSVALTIVWCISDGCGLKAKVCSRCSATLVYAAIFLALVFAPRESKYQSSLPETEVRHLLCFSLSMFFFVFDVLICFFRYMTAQFQLEFQFLRLFASFRSSLL